MAGDVVTRGKHGAAAAKRRAEEATQSLEAIRASAAEREEELLAQIDRLNLEAQQLRGQMVRRASEMAAAQILGLRENQAAEMAALKDDCDRRIRRAFALASGDEDGFTVRMDLLPDIARELGLQPVDLVPGAAIDRLTRRNLSSAKKVRAINDYHRRAGTN